MALTRTFFFNENEKKENIYKVIGVDKKSIEKYIETIASKAYNNKIGYFQFYNNQEEVYYKVYIMPKIYKVEENEHNSCGDCSKKFIDFFRHYYRIVGKYRISKHQDEFEGNISDLSYRSEESAKELASDDITDVDDFIVHNYMDSLSIIESFFTKHKKQILVEQKFHSQSIQSKLNIGKNILDPNKSNVHQIKKVPMVYSNIAVITMEVLAYFVNVKIEHFSNTDKSRALRRKASKIQVSLKQRFTKNHNLTFKLSELLLRKTSKLFEKNNEYKLVYKALLKLAGKEHYYSDNIYREVQKQDEMISIFFQPEKLYEWILYDALLDSTEFDEVLKDGKDDIKIKYELVPAYTDKMYSSEPDLVVKKDVNKYPVDAKWKILNKKDDKFDNDIAKLRRDAMIRGVNKGYLVYPKIDESSKFQLDTEYSYSYDDFVFELKVITV